jgi:hypothetical protein
MLGSTKQRDSYMGETDSYYAGLACASVAQGNEYGYSYYWWYYAIPTYSRHALEKRS